MVESTQQRKFTVDEGGNRRHGISSDDLRQALTDLTQWFKANAPKYYTKHLENAKGAPDEGIDETLNKLNAGSYSPLRILL